MKKLTVDLKKLCHWLMLVGLISSLLLTAYPQSIQSANKQPEKKRKLVSPDDPEAIALFLHLLERFDRNVSKKSEADIRLEKVLEKNPKSRELVRRTINRLNSLSSQEREFLLGKYARIPLAKSIPLDSYRTAFKRMAATKRKLSTPQSDPLDKDEIAPVSPQTQDKSELPLPSKSPAPFSFLSPENLSFTVPKIPVLNTNRQGAQRNEYRFSYTGMRCMSGPWGLGHDDIFTVTTVIDEDCNDGTTRHPQAGGFRVNET